MDVTPHTEDLDLSSVNTWEQLSALLRTVHLRADKPSLRTLEARSRHSDTPLSKTVVSEMLRGTRFPRKAVILAFLQACGIRDAHVEPWLVAWERIAEGVTKSPVQASQAIGSEEHSESSGSRVDDVTDSAEERLLREQVSRLSVENERLRLREIESESSPAIGDLIRTDEKDNYSSHSPYASRRELGILLRSLREARRITVGAAAERLLCSPAKIRGMESSFRSGTARDVRDLCEFYAVTEEAQQRRLMRLAQDSRQQGWWQSYGNPEYAPYISFENDAISINLYHSAVIPGLMQTVGYARALHQVAPYNLAPEIIEQIIEVRRIRQQILARVDPPIFHVILDEAVLRRSVGGIKSMRDQLERIIEVSELSNVSLQVIPFAAGAHGAMDSSFTILEFNDPTPAMVFAEGLSGTLYIEDIDDVERHRRVFEALSASALGERASVQFITEVIRARD